MVTIPWRSSPSWDEYDLCIYPHREADCFRFYAKRGDQVSVRAEAAPPGRGLWVRMLSEQEGETSAEASSDDHGVVELSVLAQSDGTHSVEVKLDAPRSQRPRSYRLSIDTPRGRWPGTGMRTKAAEFVDVPVGHHYREAVTAVVAAGVMTGSDEWWQFAPDAVVTRVELAEMVRRSLGGEGSGAVPVLLADLAAQDRLKGALRVVPRSTPAPDAQVVAATLGGSSVVSSGTRRSVAPIARAQAVSLIVRALERYRPGVLKRPPRGFSSSMASSVHSLDVRIAEYNGLMEGLERFGSEWDPRIAVSRGEVAQMLWQTMRPERAAAGPPPGPPLLLPTSGPVMTGVAPDVKALGVHTSEYLLGAHEEIDRLMAESGAADEPLLGGDAQALDESPSSSEVRTPGESHSSEAFMLDRAHIRHRIEQTRDRLRAQMLGPSRPMPATGATPSTGPTQEGAQGTASADDPDKPTNEPVRR